MEPLHEGLDCWDIKYIFEALLRNTVLPFIGLVGVPAFHSRGIVQIEFELP